MGAFLGEVYDTRDLESFLWAEEKLTTFSQNRKYIVVKGGDGLSGFGGTALFLPREVFPPVTTLRRGSVANVDLLEFGRVEVTQHARLTATAEGAVAAQQHPFCARQRAGSTYDYGSGAVLCLQLEGDVVLRITGVFYITQAGGDALDRFLQEGQDDAQDMAADIAKLASPVFAQRLPIPAAQVLDPECLELEELPETSFL